MKIKKIITIIAIVGIVIMAGFAWYVYQTLMAPNTKIEQAQYEIKIPTGATYSYVTTELRDVIDDFDTFNRAAERKGYLNNVKAGRFFISKGMNNNDIINTLRSKNTPVKLRFNNQERIENLAGRIATQIEADSISLLRVMIDPDFLVANELTEEQAMSLYIPNQYEFFWNTDAETFRDRMLKEHRRFWNESRTAKANALNLTKSDVYTIASIVQKETAKVDERPRVAGVYLNRLRRGMKLDADPTVIYAVKKYSNDWNQVIKRVLYKDLEVDSPYNLYKYAGLPPGPIFMPDITSIDAVLNEEKHDYLYFVANPENPGYHLFARNLAGHNRNRQAYTRWINAQGINR